MRGTSRQPTVTSAPESTCCCSIRLVVHLVDMVAGQDDHVFGPVGLDDVDVLVDRVGGALVPLGLGDALARRQDVEALVALGAEEVPAALQVADQAVRLVLGGDADPADAGVERVGQREVDDPRLAAEIDRGLGAPVGQLVEARAAAAGQHIGHGVARQGAGTVDGRGHLGSSPMIGSRLSSAATKNSVASGGRVSAAEQGWPCQGSATASTPPRLPMPEPP